MPLGRSAGNFKGKWSIFETLTNQAHFDHVGGMAEVKKRTHAKLMVDEYDAQVLIDGGNSDYVMGGKGPLFKRVKPDRLLHDQNHFHRSEIHRA